MTCKQNGIPFPFFYDFENIPFEAFVECDDEAIVAEESTDAEIIESINKDVTDADEEPHAD